VKEHQPTEAVGGEAVARQKAKHQMPCLMYYNLQKQSSVYPNHKPSHRNPKALAISGSLSYVFPHHQTAYCTCDKHNGDEEYGAKIYFFIGFIILFSFHI
jgi:hypothetical protein